MPIEFTVDPSTSGSSIDNLAEVRRLFIQASRRYDLITGGDLTTNADNGANVFINAAQRYLDRITDLPQQVRRYHALLSADEYAITFSNLIRLDSLSLITSTTRTDITQYRRTRRELKYLYAEPIAEMSSGEPTYWAFNVIGLSPDLFGSSEAELTAASLTDVADLHFGEETPDFAYNGIIFGVKADVDYNVEVEGKFYSPFLSEDTDVSIWTVSHPLLLVQAACYMVERQMKNSSGMKSWLDSMQPELNDLDNMSVEHELEGLDLTLEG